MRCRWRRKYTGSFGCTRLLFESKRRSSGVRGFGAIAVVSPGFVVVEVSVVWF
jgi:hypothetical protein